MRCLSTVNLTHWGRDKMAAVSQTMFSNALSWMKMYEFRLKFQWSLFLRFQLTIFTHWFRYWLGPVQATSHYLNQWWLVYWRIYASLGLNELNYHQTSTISCTLVDNNIVDHSDVVWASPVADAPTTSSFSTKKPWLQWIGQRQLQDETRNI